MMLGTLSVREAIIDENKTRQIPTIIAAGMSHYGMQTFDQSLLGLYKKGLITYEEAITTASNPDDFALKVKGVQSTSDVAEEDEERRKMGGLKPGLAKPGGFSPQKPGEAKEYKAPSQDTDFKIDRFGDK